MSVFSCWISLAKAMIRVSCRNKRGAVFLRVSKSYLAKTLNSKYLCYFLGDLHELLSNGFQEGVDDYS